MWRVNTVLLSNQSTRDYFSCSNMVMQGRRVMQPWSVMAPTWSDPLAPLLLSTKMAEQCRRDRARRADPSLLANSAS
jgi:hypothetical protein